MKKGQTIKIIPRKETLYKGYIRKGWKFVPSMGKGIAFVIALKVEIPLNKITYFKVVSHMCQH